MFVLLVSDSKEALVSRIWKTTAPAQSVASEAFFVSANLQRKREMLFAVISVLQVYVSYV